MAENSAVIDTVANKSNYAKANNMSTSGEYATEIELFAVASWLKTPIYTYSPYGDAFNWQKHRPLLNTASLFEPSASCMYIKNTSEHFMLVLGM